MKTKSVLIVAGGSGLRMKSTIPKQFIEINKKPIILYTIENFLNYDSNIEIIIVLPQLMKEYFSEIHEKHKISFPYKITNGGNTRFQSVKNGLKLVTNDLVAIHDAVRPCVSVDTIASCFKSAEKMGSGIPIVQVIDSIREVSDNSSTAIDRSKLRIVQTPQVFQTHDIKSALEQEERATFTDDATVFESAGFSVNLVEGNIENIKITNQIDLKLAEYYLNQ